MRQCLSEDLRYEGPKTQGSFGVLEERHHAELSTTLVSSGQWISTSYQVDLALLQWVKW